MATIFWLGLCYILGSFPFGLLVAQAFCKKDPRKLGSGNIGATNVARVCGFSYGLAVLILDILKGYLPIMLAKYFSGSDFLISLTAVVLVAGHMYSAFLYGKGGKGVATTVGIFLALAATPALWAIGICLAVIYLTGFVSLGSLALVTSAPVIFLLSGNFVYIFVALIIMGLVFWRHEENIHRLLSGEENSWRKQTAEV
ncbi:MAG: glycerol-3-phosphate 1-O-acyltransferase PlsY [Desulfonatronovibrio sp.]